MSNCDSLETVTTVDFAFEVLTADASKCYTHITASCRVSLPGNFANPISPALLCPQLLLLLLLRRASILRNAAVLK